MNIVFVPGSFWNSRSNGICLRGDDLSPFRSGIFFKKQREGMLKNSIVLVLITISVVLILAIGSSSSAQDWDLVYGDLIMDKNAEGMKEGDVDAVLFPHWFHRIRFRCKVCHEALFIQEKGANEITMDTISSGEHCGACHDGKVAWDPLFCERCHVVKLDTAKRVAKQHSLKTIEEAKIKKEVDPDDPMSILYASRTGKIAGTGDATKPAGEAYRWGLGWQPEAFKHEALPKDKYGLVQWVKLAKEGKILPKGSIDPEDPNYKEPVRFEYFDEDEDIEDVLIETKSKFMKDISFPHTLHAWWLDCKSCHPKRFVRTAGDTEMTMKEMAKGKYCGECHGKVSFSLSDCTRCHTVKKGEEE